MTFIELVRAAHERSARSGAPPATVAGAAGSELEVVDAVSSAWRELQARADWSWMRRTLQADLVPGQGSYDPAAAAPDGFGLVGWDRWAVAEEAYAPTIVQAANPGNVLELSWLDLRHFRRRYVLRPVADATPQWWTSGDDGALLVSPSPADVWSLTIDWWAQPTELAADADTPDMPTRWHYVLVWRALMDIAEVDNAAELYQRALTNHTTLFDQLWGAHAPKWQMRVPAL